MILVEHRGCVEAQLHGPGWHEPYANVAGEGELCAEAVWVLSDGSWRAYHSEAEANDRDDAVPCAPASEVERKSKVTGHEGKALAAKGAGINAQGRVVRVPVRIDALHLHDEISGPRNGEVVANAEGGAALGRRARRGLLCLKISTENRDALRGRDIAIRAVLGQMSDDNLGSETRWADGRCGENQRD